MNLVHAATSFLAGRLTNLGPTEWLYVLGVAAVMLSSLLLWRRPLANLALVTVYLASANTAILGETTTAAIAGVLIVNCALGTLFASSIQQRASASHG